MWTASAYKGVWQKKVLDRLRSYVRPVVAVARDRWPRWHPRRGFQTQKWPDEGQW